MVVAWVVVARMIVVRMIVAWVSVRVVVFTPCDGFCFCVVSACSIADPQQKQPQRGDQCQPAKTFADVKVEGSAGQAGEKEESQPQQQQRFETGLYTKICQHC